MIPYSFTITSSAAVTFFFAGTFFIGVTSAGYRAHKDVLFQLFLPPGVPKPLFPFLIVIEAMSYLARVFSLAIRLFANMMSGHGLLKILGSFAWASVAYGSFIPVYFQCVPMLVISLVILLELFIAFLQAYVFIMLVCIYLNDVICIH
jgi:ATP synthase subunit 6